MSKRERPTKPFLRALSGETLERPPFWLMRQAGRYLPEYREVRARAGSFLDLCFAPELAAEVTLQPIRRYGMDAAILFSDILVVPYALGQRLDYIENEGPRLDPVRTAWDIARLSTRGSADRLAPVLQTVQTVKAALDDRTALVGFAGSPWTVASYMVEGGGTRDFLEVKRLALSDPSAFETLIAILIDATVDYLAAQVEAGADALQLFDSWAGVLDDRSFERWVVRPTAELVHRLRSRGVGVPIIGFPRGAGLMIEHYAASTGIDAVGLDTTVPPGWAAHTLQPRLPVQGNLDPVALVVGGQALDAAIDRLLVTLGGGPYVFNLGHGVLQSTPPEAVARLAEAVRGWRRPT